MPARPRARARPALSSAGSKMRTAASTDSLTVAWLVAGSECRRTNQRATSASAGPPSPAGVPGGGHGFGQHGVGALQLTKLEERSTERRKKLQPLRVAGRIQGDRPLEEMSCRG